MFVIISHNREGIGKQIRRSLVRLAPQPSVCQIEILVCGHFGGVFEKVLSVCWDIACFHFRHSTKLVVKYYVVL